MEQTSGKSIFIWFGTALVVVAVVIAAAKFADTKSGQNGDSNGAAVIKSLPPISTVDHVRGSADAPITLIEYSDFQCPACAAYFPIVERILSEYPTQIRFAYRHFPLQQHKNAEPAAYAAEAAGKQGKFYDMYRTLFDRQADWSELADTGAEFSAYAKTLGLNVQDFERDRNLGEIEARVKSDYQDGIRATVNSTPTFFLNGKKLQNPPGYEAFKKIIDDELSTIIGSTASTTEAQ